MASFQLLENREEDELHKSRLLNVEEKPFKRITKRLIAPGSLVSTPTKLPTPPPDGMSPTDSQSTLEAETQKLLDERRQFREDVLLDFAAFDSSIARIQFLRNSNERERARYEADKQRILETAQAVRDNTVQLRVQLEESQKALEQRKKFDDLTDKITNNKLLRPRADQEINLRKLEEECRELERESVAYAETWKERKEQFGRIVEEGQQLRRLIRDEKEEVERREGMDGGEEDGEVGEGSRGGMTPKHSSMSGGATPRPDGTRQQSPDLGGLKPRPFPTGSRSRTGSRANSRAPSPAASERRSQYDDTMDVEKSAGGDVVPDTLMGDVESAPLESQTPRFTIDEPVESKEDEGEVGDQMDTT